MAKKREIVAVSFYRDWWDMLNEPAVTPDEQLAIVRAILAYAFDGVKPDKSDRTMFFATFGALKRIDRDNDRRDADVERVLRNRAKQCETKRNKAKQSETSVTERNNAKQTSNNYIINNDIVNSKEKENIKEKRFTPPTLDEVQAYCEANSIIMDAAAFYDYFSSNGWKVSGRAAMKDWKAAARNWARRENQYKQNNGTNNTSSDAEFYARVANGLATMPD